MADVPLWLRQFPVVVSAALPLLVSLPSGAARGRGKVPSRELMHPKREAMPLFAAACRGVTASSAGRIASAGRPIPARETRGRPAPPGARVVAGVAAVAAAGAAVTVVTAILAHDLLRSCCAGSGEAECVLRMVGCRRQVLEKRGGQMARSTQLTLRTFTALCDQ